MANNLINVKVNYAGLKTAQKGFVLETNFKASCDMVARLENDVNAREWEKEKARQMQEETASKLNDFIKSTNWEGFESLKTNEKEIVLLSLGYAVERFEKVVSIVAHAENGADLKQACKELSTIEGRKVLAYEMKDKNGNKVPLIEVWNGMKYTGLAVKKSGLKAVQRKEKSYLKEARKYIAFCLLR